MKYGIDLPLVYEGNSQQGYMVMFLVFGNRRDQLDLVFSAMFDVRR